MEDFIINVSEDAIEKQRRTMEEKKNPMNEKKFIFNEKNYLNTRLKPGETSRTLTVRILPVSATDPNAFMILRTHAVKVDKAVADSGYKNFICLCDEHIIADGGDGKCPLCEKSREFFNACKSATTDEEKRNLARNGYLYKPKDTFIIRVIERGKEYEGVKFWRFNAHNDGTGIYDKLMKIYDARMEESKEATGKPYSIFDLKEGRDIKIKLSYTETTGRTTTDLIESGFPTPLSKDTEQANKWINDTKSWRDIYAVKNYDYLKIIADGNIPYFDRNKNTYVVKEAEDMDYFNRKPNMSEAIITPLSNSEETKAFNDLPF